MTALTSSELRAEEIDSEKKKYVVVYYSRTGHTKIIAEELSSTLKCDIQEIIDEKKRAGDVKLISTIRDVGVRDLLVIKQFKSSLIEYRVVLIGTPMWNNSVPPPIKTFISKYKDDFKKVAFFSTHDDPKINPFEEMEDLCGKTPIATLALGKKNVDENNYKDQLIDYITKVIQL